MKLLCSVKIVPDVDKFQYDFERNTVVRENVRMILNPEDACSVAFALKAKAARQDVAIEVVTMAPKSAVPILQDLIRMGVDRVIHISDPLFSGSDSYATSKILGRYIQSQTYDLLLTGTHAIDGDTSHVPGQLAELLNHRQMSHVMHIDLDRLDASAAVFTVDNEQSVDTFEMNLPGILSLSKESKYKLPYIKYADINRDVSDQIQTLNNGDLGFFPEEIGMKGSLTWVNRTFVKKYEKRDKVVVHNDEQGIDRVYSFLKEKGFL